MVRGLIYLRYPYLWLCRPLNRLQDGDFADWILTGKCSQDILRGKEDGGSSSRQREELHQESGKAWWGSLPRCPPCWRKVARLPASATRLMRAAPRKGGFISIKGNLFSWGQSSREIRQLSLWPLVSLVTEGTCALVIRGKEPGLLTTICYGPPTVPPDPCAPLSKFTPSGDSSTGIQIKIFPWEDFIEGRFVNELYSPLHRVSEPNWHSSLFPATH